MIAIQVESIYSIPGMCTETCQNNLVHDNLGYIAHEFDDMLWTSTSRDYFISVFAGVCRLSHNPLYIRNSICDYFEFASPFGVYEVRNTFVATSWLSQSIVGGEP